MFILLFIHALMPLKKDPKRRYSIKRLFQIKKKNLFLTFYHVTYLVKFVQMFVSVCHNYTIVVFHAVFVCASLE